MLSASVCDFLEAIARLELAVDGDDLAAVRRGCETAIAKTMEPTRVFDELMLYRLSEASSTAQFSERCAGLAPADAQRSVTLARKLKAMPLTEAAWLDGTLTSGQVHAI
ncbi:MAG: hypothetical protein ABIQ73_29245, partial [Acidimicrobiales bacterium]